MLTPPDALPLDAVARHIGKGWNIAVAEIAYRPVGFGSYHWQATDTDGGRWFVTADDLNGKPNAIVRPGDEAFTRLGAALATAQDLRDSGSKFVVAPIATIRGEPWPDRGPRTPGRGG